VSGESKVVVCKNGKWWPHQWMRFCKIGELGGIMWPTQMGGIFSAELCGVKSVGLWYIDKSGGVLK